MPTMSQLKGYKLLGTYYSYKLAREKYQDIIDNGKVGLIIGREGKHYVYQESSN